MVSHLNLLHGTKKGKKNNLIQKPIKDKADNWTLVISGMEATLIQCCIALLMVRFGSHKITLSVLWSVTTELIAVLKIIST